MLVVSVISLLGWLMLNLGALRSHRLGRERTLRYALIWVGIFALVAFAASRMIG